MAPRSSSERLISELMIGGSLTGPELRQRLGGISQPTLFRRVRELQSRLLVLGSKRWTRYAARRPIPALGDTVPLFYVNNQGEPRSWGELVLIHPRASVWLRPDREPQEFEVLPYFLSDMRPQGFLGRALVRQHQDLRGALGLTFPERLQDWGDDHQLLAISLRGEDGTGNLIVGRSSFERFVAHPEGKSPLIADPDPGPAYARLDAATLAGEVVGSSAAGEQPKFTARRPDGHVLVKFSPPSTEAVGQRWADLLYAEGLALTVLGQAGLPVAPHRWFQAENRVFLETDRFDRVGARGRRGVVSLAALSDEFVGARDQWSLTAEHLQKNGHINGDDLKRIRFVDAFGALIGNTDRHFGNLSFFFDPDTLEQGQFSLAPIYDMLPMLYAPVQGELPEREPGSLAPTPEWLESWPEARSLALRYWTELAQDQRVSEGFRAIARKWAARVKEG